MDIEILGSGRLAIELERRVRLALGKAQGRAGEVRLSKLSTSEELRSRGVVAVPALFIDGELVVAGSLPSVDELVEVLMHDR